LNKQLLSFFLSLAGLRNPGLETLESEKERRGFVAGREKYKGLNEDCEPLIPTYVTSWPFISKGLGQHKKTKGVIVHLMIFSLFFTYVG